MSYEPTVWVDGDHVTSAKLNKLEQGVNSMSYTPTVWNAGDVVTAEKLNKLEQGVAEGGGGGGDFDYPTFTNNGEAWACDKTFNEVVALVGEYGDELGALPCQYVYGGDTLWQMGEYVTDELVVSDWQDMPETITTIYAFDTFSLAYANDGNFYRSGEE